MLAGLETRVVTKWTCEHTFYSEAAVLTLFDFTRADATMTKMFLRQLAQILSPQGKNMSSFLTLEERFPCLHPVSSYFQMVFIYDLPLI